MAEPLKLIHILDYQNPRRLIAAEPAHVYEHTRRAARAVMVDEGGQVCLMHAANHGYYKLPGGGLEDKEDPEVALRREVQEETGAAIEIVAPLGYTVQFDDQSDFRQDSYCYLVRPTGQWTAPELTDEERAAGFTVHIAPNFTEAIKLVAAPGVADEYLPMTIRDAAILRAAAAHSRADGRP